MTDRRLVEELEAAGPLTASPEPNEKAAAFARRLVEGALRQRFSDKLRELVQNQYEIDLRPLGSLYRISLRIDAARKYDFFWNNAGESFLEKRVEEAERAGGIAVFLACQLPLGADRLLFWQIDMRSLLGARRAAAVPPDVQSFYIERREGGGWQLRYAGQRVVDFDGEIPHGAVPIAALPGERGAPPAAPLRPTAEDRSVSPAPLIETIGIYGFKSIVTQTLELGRLNVLIGANGSGKSAILEALGMLGAAASGRVDDESMMRRGVRLGALSLYKNAFADGGHPYGVELFARAASTRYGVMLDIATSVPNRVWLYMDESIEVERQEYLRRLSPDTAHFNDENEVQHPDFDVDPSRGAARAVNPYGKTPADVSRMLDVLEGFAIFDAQTPILRGMQADPSPRSPVGLGGGKLAEAVQSLLQASVDRFGLMPRDDLFELINWASDFAVGPPSPELTSPTIPAASEIVRFTDRHLSPEEGRNILSGYDASEGALYVLFVLTLLFHPGAPPFFAMENIDHTLHPRLARKLVEVLVQYVERAGRQIVVTAHNPLVLDALPLADDAVRLFAVDRNAAGHTGVHRVAYTEAVKIANERGLTLSQMWIRGLLGAVPDIG